MTQMPIPFNSVPERVLKRAQYEALEFELIGSNVLVRNASYADPENHEYEVTIEAGVPTHCTCPADARFDNPCKHRVGVAIRRPILAFVEEVQLLTDGGMQGKQAEHASEQESSEVDTQECACEGLDGVPCWECYRSGKRDLP